ncbi:MAG TPA: dipicolinate synthase subunit DpsA [Bacillota bacterium]|nr:dipicolinate synthase subunit DpsA [Bacillota bacterium]
MECDYHFQVAVVGGDVRQIAVAEALTGIAQGVKTYGHPQERLPESVVCCTDLESVLSDANVVVLPISGMNDSGMVRSYQADQFIDFGRYLNVLERGTVLVAGSLTARWLEQAVHQGLKVIQYAEDDTIAILNSIPTAEGAVQIAMEQLPVTVHGSQVLVIGFGRVGATVARTFKGLGAKVLVAARRSELLARATEMGFDTVVHQHLTTVLGKTQIIINTVPAVVVDREALNRTLSDVLIIDLASAPGGIDFSAARELGRKAIFAPGLPGKVAPQTAGRILAAAIPEMIIKAVSS